MAKKRNTQSAQPAQSSSGSSTSSSNGSKVTSNSTAKAIPTVKVMIVCVPDGLSGEVLNRRQLDEHFGVSGTLSLHFWATPGMWMWQRSQLVDPRKGHPTVCAGGPAKLLDLRGMRHAAGLGAGMRHQMWSHAVQGTRPATPWPQLLHQHLADPDILPLQDAIDRFNNQPRVIAMRMHNAVSFGAGLLDLHELEMLQAGPMAYAHYRASTALAADTVITADGHRLAPESDAFAHRVTFLEQANRHLASIDDQQRLLAVAL